MSIKQLHGEAISTLNNLRIALDRFAKAAQNASTIDNREKYVKEAWDEYLALTERYGALTRAVIAFSRDGFTNRYPDIAEVRLFCKDK